MLTDASFPDGTTPSTTTSFPPWSRLGGWLAVDPLGLTVLTLTSVLFLVTVTYAVGYLRRERPTLPVLMLSIHPEDELGIRASSTTALSFDGVEYDVLEHELTAEQTAIYDAYADAWAMLAWLCIQDYAQSFNLQADSLASGSAAARRATPMRRTLTSSPRRIGDELVRMGWNVSSTICWPATCWVSLRKMSGMLAGLAAP